MRRITRAGLLLLGLGLGVGLAGASTGCGITGNTSTFVVNVRSEQAKGPIKVDSIELEPNQSKLVNVGTYAWGKYDEADLEVLTKSMKDSAASLGGATPFGVHVVIRRFLVATGGSDGIALACISWALTMPDGTLIFHEQFYASKHVRTFGTVGGIKDTVHEALTKRVLGRAAAIATAPGSNAFESVKPERTFDTYEDAIRDLPPSLTAVSVGIVQLGNGYTYYTLKQGQTSGSQLEWVKQPDHLDWPTRMTTQKR
jgi:hypothetical protein